MKNIPLKDLENFAFYIPKSCVDFERPSFASYFLFILSILNPAQIGEQDVKII